MRLILVLAALVCWLHMLVRADIFSECDETTESQFISSNRSCAHYIYCNGEDSYDGDCQDGDYFSGTEQMCVPKNEVDCRQANVGVDSNNTSPSSPITTQTSISKPNSPPSSSTLSISSASSSLFSRPPTTAVSALPATSSPTSSSGNDNTINIISAACPPIDDPRNIVFMANPKACSEYFVCYHGEPLAMHCSPMLHFNSRTGKCDHAEVVKCLADVTTVKQQCQSHTVDMYPHPTNCNYFYFCRNGYLLLQQCPFFYGWDYEKRACVTLRQAKCYAKPKTIVKLDSL